MGFFPANFQLSIWPSVLDLGSGTGQTDDGHQRIMWWLVGHNKVSVKENDEDQPDIVRKMISETENAYQNEQY